MLKRTDDIINNLWCVNPITPVVVKKPLLKKQPNEISFEDVDIWEEIYLEKGNIGIYAAYDPYSEYFMIIYQNIPLKEFYTSENEVVARAKELGIPLSR